MLHSHCFCFEVADWIKSRFYPNFKNDMNKPISVMFLNFLTPKNSTREQDMSLVMRKPAFCICKNKDADQLCSNCAAYQHLCFLYTDSTIPLLPKSEFQASSRLLWLYSLVCVGPGRKP